MIDVTFYCWVCSDTAMQPVYALKSVGRNREVTIEAYIPSGWHTWDDLLVCAKHDIEWVEAT